MTYVPSLLTVLWPGETFWNFLSICHGGKQYSILDALSFGAAWSENDKDEE